MGIPIIPPRILVPVSNSLTARLLDTAASQLRRRDDDDGREKKPPNRVSIIVAAIVVGILAVIATMIMFRTIRSRHPSPKYIPTPVLKRWWTNWKVPSYRPHAYEATRHDEESARLSDRTNRNSGLLPETQSRRASAVAAADAGVDRNVSVRSTITLPVYRPKPGEDEQVLGREGERAGIDIVVEMPTDEMEEELREEEMDALYQIRAARRRQIAEREERRRLRQEARDANNVVALQELRERARGQAGRNTQEIDNLRQEHERIRGTRNRTVSSVSYADLGVARADGTRLRANSTESERVGLLSDAASIGQSTTSVGPDSLLHRRERSASSALSIDTARSNEHGESPGLTTTGSNFSLASAVQGRSRANSGTTTPRFSTTSTRAGSSPEIIDAEDGDLGDSGMPPPGYDEVSLDEITPANSGRNSAMSGLSGRNSPYNEPPPDYPGGPAQRRNNRLSAHMDDLAAQALPEEARQRHSPRSPPGSAIPQLPSLRLGRLPQIVIEPSSSRP